MRKSFLSTVIVGALLCSLIQANPPTAAVKDKVPLPIGTMDAKEWLKQSTAKLEPGEIDRMVNSVLQKVNIKAAPLTTDEQFIRRVTLDLTGRPPTPADLSAFLADKDKDKRAKLIDKLLQSDEFARHWSLYFRDVIQSRATDFRSRLFAGHFDRWLTEQLKTNQSWSKITREMLTATGPMRNDEPNKNGQAYFLNSRTGADAVTELTAETSRIFLGIQIQCAQCNDHPSDVWKRQQFHEMAAFLARVRSRPIFEEQRIVGQDLVSTPFGEHRMPDSDDPKKGNSVSPKFIDGKAPKAAKSGPAPAPKLAKAGFPMKDGKKSAFPKGPFPKGGFGFGAGGLSDEERRKALTDYIVSKDNPWFAGAFVNRIWGELMGQAFYQPIDDMGPQKEAYMPDVLARVAGSFRGSDYDIKELFRELLNTEVYQRQIRPGESTGDHLLFAAANPTRMSANALWHTLVGTLGTFGGPGGFAPKMAMGPFGRFGGLEGTFKQEFGFDPSTKADEVEGSVSQALLLMNNPQINAKIKAGGTNLLGRILSQYGADDEALRTLYMRTLGRRPTDREMDRCREHVRAANSRAEAYEDILWALINSTEYQMER
ncbi:MAG: DUF1549 and DUF1553 domain-containing protein [Gemmataceae bacterium]|nr:DUF1549 and DUF1553 domain-containing protein [Gemmataceae bacterium]MCI0743671.1 DUF1549 and DUF1553 domain-containing protein [Gemmataceae bacterium]